MKVKSKLSARPLDGFSEGHRESRGSPFDMNSVLLVSFVRNQVLLGTLGQSSWPSVERALYPLKNQK